MSLGSVVWWFIRCGTHLGCVLLQPGEVTHWFASALFDAELGVVGVYEVDESKQVLGALVALRAWSSHWQSV